MNKMTGDEELLVDIDLDLPANVAAASGWLSPEDDEPKQQDAKGDAGADTLPAKELADARRAAKEAQARLDEIQKQAQTDRQERLRAQEEAQKNQTYALNAHLARMDSHLARVQADHDQLNTSIGAWKSHVDMAKRQLAVAIEAGDAKAQAEMNAQIAEAASMLTQLEAGRLGAQRDIEAAKLDREAAIRAAQAAAEKAQEEAQKRVAPQSAAPTPDDFVKTVRGKIGDHAGDWFDKHREFVTDKRLHDRMQTFVADWIDRNGEQAIHTQKFTDALDERFGFAQPKKTSEAETDEETEMEDEKPARAPAAPVSRGNSVGKQPGTTGSKVRLNADEAATASLMYPDLSPQEARKKYATNKARLIADGRL